MSLSLDFLDGHFSLEDTIEFNDVTVPVSFHDLLNLEPMAAPTTTSGAMMGYHLPAPSIDTEAAFNKCSTPSSFCGEEEEEEDPEESRAVMASPVLEDAADCGNVNPAWERELEMLITQYDGQVPIDEKLKEELLAAGVKDFNRRTKAMKLDEKTVEYLKLQRKRDKNRRAAIRSRSRKDVQVTDLQEQVDVLQQEKSTQSQTIRDLQARVAFLESQLQQKGRRA